MKNEYFDTLQYKPKPEHLKMLKEQSGLDDRLAFHIASLFVRDPVPTFDFEHDEPNIDVTLTTAHFENLQSSNWCSMRFKPPPKIDSEIGWRVEFRTMDIQLTDFENAALIVTLNMILNVVNEYDVNFIMPISKIDENMNRAHLREAAFKQKFWFRTNILPDKENFMNSELIMTNFIKSHHLEMEFEDDF